MGAIENTADEGQTASHSFIGGKNALLCHCAMNPGLLTPSAAYTFGWTGYLGAGNEGTIAKALARNPDAHKGDAPMEAPSAAGDAPKLAHAPNSRPRRTRCGCRAWKLG